MNKRGLEKKIVAELIIAIFIGVVVLIVVYIFIAGVSIKEGICKVKSSALSLAPNDAIKTAVSGFTSCSAINEKIDGNDFSKCTNEIEKQFNNCKGDEICKLEAQRNCAAYQMAKLAERCWFMYSGTSGFEGISAFKRLCGYPCFNIEVFDTGGQVDLVDRSKQYVTAGHGLAANFYVPKSCTSTKDVKLRYVDDHEKDQDGVCLKC